MDMRINEMEAKDRKETLLNEELSIPQYPHGLCLYIDSESVKKLNLKKTPQIGEAMVLRAIAMVKEVEIEEGQKDDMNNYSFKLQIKDLEVMQKPEAEEEKMENPKPQSSTILYGGVEQ